MSTRHLRAVATAVALTLAAPAALAADEDPAAWLIKMSEAARIANYEGSMLYSGDQISESFRVTHRFRNGAERERVQSLSGEKREIEKQGDKTICLLPESRRVELPTPKGLFPGLTRERLEQVAQVYKFEDLGEGRVAGRLCRGVAIVPHDNYRYGYQVWADAQTGVPLKMELRDNQGRALERMEFFDVKFPADIPDTAFANTPAIAAPAPVPANVPALPPALAARFGGKLPQGFTVARREVRTVPGKGVVEHWLLTDGLSAISVFTQRQVQTRSFRGISRIGALNAYGTTRGTIHITVVGEVPQATVKMVGDGLKVEEVDVEAAKP